MHTAAGVSCTAPKEGVAHAIARGCGWYLLIVLLLLLSYCVTELTHLVQSSVSLSGHSLNIRFGLEYIEDMQLLNKNKMNSKIYVLNTVIYVDVYHSIHQIIET